MLNIEVRRISEKEIRIGENIDRLIEGNIIFVEAIGEQTKEIAELQWEICHELSKKIDGKTNFLIDLNKCGKNSPEARNIWQQFSDEENTEKVATYGIHPVARVIASFVINVSRKNKEGGIKFFKTKKEAMDWLQDQ